MKLQIFSDMHFEYYPELFYNGYIASLKEPEVDVVVLAGDIITWDQWNKPYLKLIINQFAKLGKKLIYVMGNHEYFNTSFADVNKLINDLNNNENIFIVGASRELIFDDKKFLCGTMWYRREDVVKLPNSDPDNGTFFVPKYNSTHQFADFRLVNDAGSNIYKQNKEFQDSLNKHYDVIITHHLPHELSTPKEFIGNDNNCFFVCDQGEYIMKHSPKYWIHGHTHTKCDYLVRKARVICNPKGYPGEKPGKYSGLVITI